MNQELKDEIITTIQENKDQFQLNNFIVAYFHGYIYNEQGNYLIGGEKVAQFINDFIKLYTNENI